MKLLSLLLALSDGHWAFLLLFVLAVGFGIFWALHHRALVKAQIQHLESLAGLNDANAAKADPARGSGGQEPPALPEPGTPGASPNS